MDEYYNPNDYWIQMGYDPYKGMDEKGRMRCGCLSCVLIYAAMVAGLMLCALLSGCTTTRSVTNDMQHTATTDTIYQVRVERDSIVVKDSVSVIQWMRGDTVFVERDRWRDRWRDRIRIDTCWKTHTDTLVKIYERTTESVRRLTFWQRMRMDVGGIVILGLIIFVVGKIFVTLRTK